MLILRPSVLGCVRTSWMERGTGTEDAQEDGSETLDYSLQMVSNL